MYNNNKKRLLDSPPSQVANSPKLHKSLLNTTQSSKNQFEPAKNLIEQTLYQSEMDGQVEEQPKLTEREKLMLDAFTQSMCTQLDKRFETFSKDVIGPMKKDLTDVKVDVGSLKLEVASLKEERGELLAKLDNYDKQINYLQKESRASNLVFFNIPCNDDIGRCIEDVCRGLLQINEQISIVKTVVMKENKSRKTLTVLAKFASPATISLILKNANKLKGQNSNIGISRDVSEEERKERAVLIKLRKCILDNDHSKQSKVNVVGNSIFINKVKLTFKIKTKYFGNSNIDGRAFIRENFSLDFDNLLTNMQ